MPNPTSATFDAAAAMQSVAFEYDMAVHTATLVHPRLGKSSNTESFVISVALIESFLVHARCLDEFLESRGTRPDDIRASDFVPGFSQPALDSTLRESINKALQHLTLGRRERRVEWVPLKVLPHIVSTMETFIDQLAMSDPGLAAQLDRAHRAGTKAIASGPSKA